MQKFYNFYVSTGVYFHSRATFCSRTYTFTALHCGNIVYLQHGGSMYCRPNDVAVTPCIACCLVAGSRSGVVFGNQSWIYVQLSKIRIRSHIRI